MTHTTVTGKSWPNLMGLMVQSVSSPVTETKFQLGEHRCGLESIPGRSSPGQKLSYLTYSLFYYYFQGKYCASLPEY